MSVKTIDVPTVAAALQFGDLDGIVRPFLAAAHAKLGSRQFRRAGITADAAKPAKNAASFGTVNVRGLVDWINSIDPRNKEHKAQCDALCSLVATAEGRLGVKTSAAKAPPAAAAPAKK